MSRWPREFVGDADRVPIGEWWFEADRGYPLEFVREQIRRYSAPPRIPLPAGWVWARSLQCRQGEIILRLSRIHDPERGIISAAWIPVEVAA